MSKWKTVRLGDVCEIQSGGTPSRSKQEYWKNGNIPWIKIGDFSGKYLSQSSEFITEEGLNNSSAKLFSKGTILYSIFATLGEVTILDIDASTNQAIAGIGIKSNTEIDIDFFYSYLKSLKDEVNRIGRGVAQNNINLSILRDFKIPLPPLETQKQIASTLDKCTSLISKYKQILKKYDTLIKSRFIEMFGENPVESGKWKVDKMSNICSIQTGGTPSRSHPEYFDGNIPWITTANLGKNELNYEDAMEYITKEAIDNSATKIIPANSLFIGIRVGVGKCSINKVDMCSNQDICGLSGFDTKSINLVFLKKVIDSYSNFFENAKRGTTIKGVKSDMIKNLKIFVPDINIQNDFASFVQQIDKSKFENNYKELVA